MSLTEKAKDLGREITNTPEFKELQRAEQNLQEDTSARQLIKDFQELQQQMTFMQKTGTEPTPEQATSFNELREKVQTSVTVRVLLKAQEEFNTVIKSVNESISEGIAAETEETGLE